MKYKNIEKDRNTEKRLAEIDCGMITLTFELTRCCNMNCDFCAKGEAQEADITKEIIDKTLDEMQYFYIRHLRLGGGEPFLNPEMIVYLIDEIIRRRIYVKYLAVFTNGLIKNEDIKTAFERFIRYAYSIERETEILEEKFGIDYRSNYNFNGERVTVIISSCNHPIKKEFLNNTAKFYNYGMNKDDFLCFVQEDNSDDIVYIVSGKFKENYEHILQDKQAVLMRSVRNKYYFAYKNLESSTMFICKNLSISTNGNVFPGASLSYKETDEIPMFNILTCKNNFMEQVVDWCWLYPTIGKINYLRELYEGAMWGNEQGISCRTQECFEYMKKYCDYSYECEDVARQLHREYPKGDFDTVYNLSIAVVYYAYYIRSLFNFGVLFSWENYMAQYAIRDMKNQPINEIIHSLLSELQEQ